MKMMPKKCFRCFSVRFLFLFPFHFIFHQQLFFILCLCGGFFVVLFFFFSNFLWTFNQVILLQLVINSQNPTWKGKAFWEIAVVGAYSQ